MKILVAVDGSPYSRAATRYLAHHKDAFSGPLEITLLHVRPPIPYPRVAAVAGKEAVEKYQLEESQAALAVAEKELAALHIPYRSEWRVGDLASEVASYAREHAVDLVIMGSHGHGALAGLALGSAATKLIATLTVPVLVITRASALHASRGEAKARREAARKGEAVETAG